jgi:hypothetical protein
MIKYYFILIKVVLIACCTMVNGLSLTRSAQSLTISFGGDNTTPSWQIVIDRSNAANITQFRIPQNGPDINAKSDWPLFIPVTINKIGKAGNMSKGRELFRNFTVPTFNLLKESQDTIIVETGGDSPNKHYHHTRTYIITNRTIHMTGEVNPYIQIWHVGLWPHFKTSLLKFRADNKLPVRTQGNTNWSYMSSASDDHPHTLPSGVGYPLETYLEFITPAGTFLGFQFKKFEAMPNNEFLYRIRGAETMVILTHEGNLSAGNKQHYEVTIFFSKDQPLPITSNMASLQFPFKVYPNPFYSDIIITGGRPVSGQGNLSLYDVLGNKIYCNMYKGDRRRFINGAGLPKGVYFLKTSVNGRSLQKKVIKLN